MMTLTPEFKRVVETNVDMVLVRLSFLVITFHSGKFIWNSGIQEQSGYTESCVDW